MRQTESGHWDGQDAKLMDAFAVARNTSSANVGGRGPFLMQCGGLADDRGEVHYAARGNSMGQVAREPLTLRRRV